MSEHKNPAEAIEAAAEAIETLAENDKSRKTPSVGPFSDHKIRSLAALILAAASLLATLGTFLKTCDHSVTENSYNTLSESIKNLNEATQKNHDDLVALHGYLDGLAHAPLVPAPSSSTLAILPTPSATISATPVPHDGGLTTFAIKAPPLPSVHSATVPVEPPPFAQAAAAPAK